MYKSAHNKKKPLIRLFLGITAILIVIGLIFVYSASSVYALETHNGAHYFVKKQLIGLLLGLVGIILIQTVQPATIMKLAPIGLLGTTILTGLTLLPSLAKQVHGSRRWLSLTGFTFQSSELLKIAVILFLATFLAKLSPKRAEKIVSYIPLLIMIGIPCFILLRQPDFGLSMTILLTTFILLFIARVNLKLLFLIASPIIPLSLLLIIMRPYRLQRILTFLNPWNDPKGSGFQIIQSLIAIGSGGIWGTGIGQSKQKFFYLPMQHTDFIFSIIAEETGLIGCTILITLFTIFLYVGIRLAWQLNNTFSRFATLGFVVLISLQAVINMMVATGLAPTKGLGLPFISYGNTALVCNMCIVGLIINFVRND